MKNLPFLRPNLWSTIACLVLATVIAPPLFISDFRIEPQQEPGESFIFDALLADQLSIEPDKNSELAKRPAADLLLSHADLGRLDRHLALIETGVPYLDYLADDRVADPANGRVIYESLAGGPSGELQNGATTFFGGEMVAYGGHVGAASTASTSEAATAGGLSTYGFGLLAGFAGMPGASKNYPPGSVTTAELARDGRKKTTDVRHEQSGLGEGSSAAFQDASLEMIQSAPGHSNPWGGGDSIAASVHQWLADRGVDALPASLLNTGRQHHGPLVPLGSPTTTAGGPVVKLADVPSPDASSPLALAPLAVPEPNTVALLGLGLALFGVLTLRRPR